MSGLAVVMKNSGRVRRVKEGDSRSATLRTGFWFSKNDFGRAGAKSAPQIRR